MPAAKPLTKEMILAAMSRTKSNRAASRYLNCSYQHYKKWAKLYKSDKEGYDTLFDEHKNQMGKGIPKHFKGSNKDFAVKDIIEGRLDPSSFDPEKIKYKLMLEGYLKEECSQCGFKERRVVDYRMPLLLHFKDNNKKHYRLDNLELLCYNCYFLTIGNIFSEEQIRGIEDHKTVNKGEVKWELDDYHYERLKELGLDDDEEDEFDIISRL